MAGRRLDVDVAAGRLDAERAGAIDADAPEGRAQPAVAEPAVAAVGWARQFGLPREPLDRWHTKVKTEKAPDISAGRSIDNHRFLGPEGPAPTVEVHTSFNEERPVVTSVQFFWPGRRAPGGATSGT